MQQLKKDMLACLQQLKGSGKFASIQTAGFLFPGLEVAGVGEIAYPVNKPQALESAIKRVVIDLKTETIKKGSPHTLRITKTIDAHKREMKDWHEDVALLEKVKEKALKS